MKEKVKAGGALRLRLRRWLAAMTGRQTVRRGGRIALFAAGSGLLATLSVAGAPIPLAACVPAALCGAERTAGIVGCLAGYLLYWDLHTGLWPAALSLILPAVSFLLRKSGHRTVLWFLPAAYTAAAAAVDLGFLWQLNFPQRELGQCFVGLLVIFAGSILCRQAISQHRRWAALSLGWCLLAALSAFNVAGWFLPGVAAALFLTAGTSMQPEAMAVAAACGVALELAAPVPFPYTAFLCVCSAGCCLVRHGSAFGRGIVLLLLGALFSWLCGGVWAQTLLLSCIVGTLCALPVPRLRLLGNTGLQDAGLRMRQQLQQAADVLLRLHDSILVPQPRPSSDPDLAALFDHAAEQVCRQCENWPVCWEREAAATYHALCHAATQILEHGRAEPEDFPAAFAGRCQQLPAFASAVNDRLDRILCRRQYRARQQESRELLRSQYLLLSRYLQAAADGETGGDGIRYRPEVAARAMGKNGRPISGDRGMSFHGPGKSFFILLCDGMGTGRAAAAESTAAIQTLSGLLRAGMDASSALELLNSAYVLRDNGCFSTVDLFQLNLASGDGVLLKWGAAPSYLKRGGTVRRLGQPTVPPGLDVYGLRGAQHIRLTLQAEDLIVLASDGAGVLETERRIIDDRSTTAHELTAHLIAGAQPDDDLTVVAMRLHDAPAA